MKKAVQYIQETFLILEDDKPALSLPDIWAIIEDHLEDRFKEYGRQCAEQALKKAADKHRDTHKTLSDWEHAREEIKETPILTP